MNAGNQPYRKLLWVSVFGAAFGMVESAVVVYLRALYYPDGFAFPLVVLPWQHFTVELIRELATIIMLAAVGILAGTKAWERFGYFLVAFGVWDIFYYIWLKGVLHWPASLFEWDVLFLIPLPWIGPVLAPVLVSLMMIAFGGTIAIRAARGDHFKPTAVSWVLSLAATLMLLFSFTQDLRATLDGQLPQPYNYWFLGGGLVLYGTGFWIACRNPRHNP